MQRDTLFSVSSSMAELQNAFGANDDEKRNRLRMHLPSNDMQQLAQDFPWVIVYYASYEAQLNYRALCSPIIADKRFRIRVYLSEQIAVKNIHNSDFVKEYVAIQIPTEKIDLAMFVTTGKTILRQRLTKESVAVVNNKYISNERVACIVI